MERGGPEARPVSAHALPAKVARRAGIEPAASRFGAGHSSTAELPARLQYQSVRPAVRREGLEPPKSMRTTRLQRAGFAACIPTRLRSDGGEASISCRQGASSRQRRRRENAESDEPGATPSAFSIILRRPEERMR